MDNPYNAFVGLMRQQGAVYNDKSNELGTVLSVSPLIIGVGELRMNNNHIMLSASLGNVSVNDRLVLIHIPKIDKYVAICKVV